MMFGLFSRAAKKGSAENHDARAKLEALDRSLAIIEFDPSGNILDANDNFLNLMGYSPDELSGQHHNMFVSRQERQSRDYQVFWENLRNGEFQQGEYHRYG